MLSDGYLIDISRYLQEKSISESSEIKDIQGLLWEIYNLPSYQSWLNDGQFFTRNSERSRYNLPVDFGIGISLSDKKKLLDKYFLINGFELTVKIDKHRGRIHLTDGNWVPASKRVYPYVDESETLLSYAESKGLLSDAELLIDPACGCGHHAFGSPDIPIKTSFDINARALAYCHINSLLCGEKNMLVSAWDVRRGLHPILPHIAARHALILVNMPFAIFPKLRDEFGRLAQDGGERGIELTRAALQSIHDFISKSHHAKVSALVLCYSLGPHKENAWEVETIARSLFPDGQVSFHVLAGEPQWRVNGRKEQPNPMPIESIRLKGNCAHSYSITDMPNAVEGYDRLIASLLAGNFREMAYGIVHIEARGGGSS